MLSEKFTQVNILFMGKHSLLSNLTERGVKDYR